MVTHHTGPPPVESTARARVPGPHLRQDRWWASPVAVLIVFAAFIVYATWRALAGSDYYAAPYLSPLYSPCLAAQCVDGAREADLIGSWWRWTPAVFTLWIPLAFRFSCYYYRKAYYRAVWMAPQGCAVREPHATYTGETRFPLVLQNLHRYAFVLAALLNIVLTYDAVIAFRDVHGHWGHAGLGTLILVVNALLLWLYTLSCHSCRHIVGGRLRHFSRHPARYRLWTWVSRLNARHQLFAWISLVFVAFTDFYVWMVAAGHWTDLRFF